MIIKQISPLSSSIKSTLAIALFATVSPLLQAKVELSSANWPAAVRITTDASDVTITEQNSQELLGPQWLLNNGMTAVLGKYYFPEQGREQDVALSIFDNANLFVYLGVVENTSPVTTSWLVATRTDIPNPSRVAAQYYTSNNANFTNLNDISPQTLVVNLGARPNNQAWQRVNFSSTGPVPAGTHLYLRLEAGPSSPAEAQTLVQGFQIAGASSSQNASSVAMPEKPMDPVEVGPSTGFRNADFKNNRPRWEAQKYGARALGQTDGHAVASWSRDERNEFFADRNLGGEITLDRPLMMTGEIEIENGSLDLGNGQYLGWFNTPSQTWDHMEVFGIMFNENRAFFRAARHDSQGQLKEHLMFEILTGLGGLKPRRGTFSLSYTPEGGSEGAGLIQVELFGEKMTYNLAIADAEQFKSFRLNSFGLLKPTGLRFGEQVSSMRLMQAVYFADGGTAEMPALDFSGAEVAGGSVAVDRSTIYGYTGEALWFNATESKGDGDFRWDFGDGQSGQGEVLTHQFAQPGEYIATVSLTNAKGHTATAEQKVIIEPAPQPVEGMPYRGILFNYLDPNNHLFFPWDHRPGRSQECRFYDLNLWREKIDELADAGINRVAIVTDHPYPHLMRIPGYPEAQTDSDEVLQKTMDTFRQVVAMANARGMRFQMLVYNIWLPETFEAAYGVKSGQDTDIARDYTAACIRALYETYPEFGELILTVGEHGRCVDFCRAAITDVMAEMDPQPSIIIRDQVIHPKDIRYVAGEMEDWSTLVKITEEQYCGEIMGYRGKLVRRATGKPNVYLQSWFPAGLFEGSYTQIRTLVGEARKNYADGIIIAGLGSELWYYREAFGYYMENEGTSLEEDRAHFIKAVREKFGRSIPAELFVDTADLIGQALPKTRTQFFGRNWHNMQQYGTLIDSKIAMPPFNAFLHPHGGEEEFYYWMPRHERTNKEWIRITEAVSGSYSPLNPDHILPQQYAQQLRDIAAQSVYALSELSKAEPTRNETLWDEHLYDLKYQAEMARFYAARTEAAIRWQEWVTSKVSSSIAITEIENLLDESILAYEKALQLFHQRFGSYGPPHGMLMVASGDTAHWSYHARRAADMRELLQAWRWEKDEILRRIKTNRKILPQWPEFTPNAPQTKLSDPEKSNYRINVGVPGDSYFMGFHGIEGVADTDVTLSSRWTGENAAFRLPVLSHTNYIIGLEMHVPPFAVQDEMGIYFDEQLVAPIEEGHNALTIEVTTGEQDELILDIKLRNWKPSEELESPDTRTLGAQVYAVSAKAIGTTEKLFYVN